MKTIKLSDEMYRELVQIVRITVSERTDWVKCCERDPDLEYKYTSEAKNDLAKTEKLLNKLYKVEK